MIAVIIAGSKSDENHVRSILAELDVCNIKHETHYLSAHKNTKELLELLDILNSRTGIVFITIAGMSNALSGVVACNTKHPVIACPPFQNPENYMIDIHSTLRMPSHCPVLVVLSPKNCVMAIERMINLKDE
jgi:5-(carboxyamino)imidazole ribonucleotide mutase